MQPTFTRSVRVAAFCVVFLAAARSEAVVAWQESVNGDLSNSGSTPTLVPVAAGTNSVIATMPGSDLDFLRISVPSGHVFSGLTLASYASADGTSFIGVRTGTTIAVTGNPATLLGYAHFGNVPGNVGEDILPEICTGEGAQGCTPPLASGNYAFWIQQASTQATSYQFDFLITALPTGIPGDYNEDNIVNGADYTVWRDNMDNPSFDLPNEDATEGTVSEEDFAVWRAHFGEVPPPGGGAGAGGMVAVPEPTGAVLSLMAAIGAVFSRNVMRRRIVVTNR